jgi:alpha-beta hydrolase superfamily lysophospholipase
MDQDTHQVKAADGTDIVFDRFRGPIHDAAVILCPGFFQSRRTPTLQRLAGVLAQYCSVLSMDFRGHGDSGGTYTFSASEAQDLEAVYRWAQQRYEKVGLLGFSLGAATAINMAAKTSDVRTLVSVSAPSSFDEIEFKFWTVESLQTGLGSLEPGSGCRPGNPGLEKERPIDSIRALSKIPVFLVHGTKDTTILPSHSERLFQAAGEPKRLLLIEGGGHAEELFRCFPEEFLPPVQDWLRTTLMGETITAGKVRHVEGTLRTPVGFSFYQQQWAEMRTQTPLLFIHDLGDHSGRSVDSAYWLAHNGCAVYALDLPGHGQTPGRRGHVKKFSDLTDCVTRMLRYIQQKEQGRKPVLMGQGLGGLIATLCAAENPESVEALVLCSPLWALSRPPPVWRQLLSHTCSMLLPALPSPPLPIRADRLSHDPQAVFRYKTDPMVHSSMSVRFATELDIQMEKLPGSLSRLDLPVLVLQAADDSLVPWREVRDLFGRIGTSRKKLVLYDGFFHDLLNEQGKERILMDMQHWLRRGKMEGNWGGTSA